MRALQKELAELQEDRVRDRDREHMRQQEHEQELQILRDHCETLEAERDNGGSGVSVSLSPFYRLLSVYQGRSSADNYGLICEGSWKSLQSFRGVTTN